tara:strand:- start:1368 stop:1709 length:342 start_codon:yes stop_codon:yes gene_type:complete
MDCPTNPARINPKTTIISITNTTAIERGTFLLMAHVTTGLQAIAIKSDNKNGTTITLAALIPAKTITIDANISNTLSEDEDGFCIKSFFGHSFSSKLSDMALLLQYDDVGIGD